MATASTAEQLQELLTPVGVRGFVADYVGRKPLLLRSRPELATSLVSLQRVVEAVASPEAESGRLLVDDAELAGEVDVWRYVEAGRPIVWNGARGATPALDVLTDELARAFAASVWANVYSTGTAAKPFDVHFDLHDVLAVQCEGEKEWFVSKVRVNCPLDVPALAPTIRRALTERREEALAEPLMTVVTRPGDVLYIPRGQFHDTQTPTGRSLHVTLAIAPPTGIDVIEVLARMALREALFREYLPHALSNPPSAQTHLARLGDRLAELTRSPELQAELDRLTACHTQNE